MFLWLCLALVAVLGRVETAGAGAARLVCYVQGRSVDSMGECTHLVYTGDERGDKLDGLLKEYRKHNPRLKILLRVVDADEDYRNIMKSKYIQGLEVFEAHKTLNRTKVLETLEAARTAITKAGGGPLFLALPSHPELVAKYYDLRVLVKVADLMMLQTHALGLVKKMTYHPSRLSGLWDMMNTDSVVDLTVGLGVPASKIVISLPATARQFTLQNQTLSTPGSPTLDEEPKEIDQEELCRRLSVGRWTLERDQDLSAPYAFKNETWISFEDASSVDVKGKYARVRGLAGLALQEAHRDTSTSCGPLLRTILAKVLNSQSRAPRAAVLRSLEHEILSSPTPHLQALDALQLSPYRITQVVDSDGVIHSIREDTRTEFSCSRQGYFVHPRSCARFYRCVKFDQLSPEYTVFEFDCPAGLAFDSRYEVCVWPGSLPHSQACPGSSEIAPVPQTRFVCPAHEGYYADPENCRWFFACLDHGKAPLSAYEFRCPFGLGFDADKLKCDWPWLVPACGNIARYEADAFGYSGAALTGATGFHGQTADDVNIAGHQSLISGASFDNHVGLQTGFLSQADALDGNFIASQEIANRAHGAFGLGVNSGHSYDALNTGRDNLGLVQPTRYNNNNGKYTSGSLILDEYRLPTNNNAGHNNYNINLSSQDLTYGNTAGSYSQGAIHSGAESGANGYINGYNAGNSYSSSSLQNSLNIKSEYKSGFRASEYQDDNSGAYVHDPSGDYAVPYKHIDAPSVPYVHDGSGYKHQSEDAYLKYESDGQQNGYDGKYVADNSGQHVHGNSGSYYNQEANTNINYKSDHSGSYKSDYSGSYNNDDSGRYIAGIYRNHVGSHTGYTEGEGFTKFGVSEGSNDKTTGSVNIQHHSNANSGEYLSGNKAYSGSYHTLAAGAVNVGLVGKTTLVDTDYYDQASYNNGAYNSASQSHSFDHGVSVTHVGSDNHNLNSYSYVTTPTTSGIPTTATPIAVTSAIPVTTYKTTFVQEQPKSSVQEIFGYSQPAITHVQPTVVAIKQQYVPDIELSKYNQGANYQSYSTEHNYNGATEATAVRAESAGYDYPRPAIKFEERVSTYTTPAPILKPQPTISTYTPNAVGQQTIHETSSVNYGYAGPTVAVEEPFRKSVAYTTGVPIDTAYAKPTLSTPSAHSYSHQTIHKVEAAKVDTYSPSVEQEEHLGYKYSQPAVQLHEVPRASVEYSTPHPAVVSTYKPQFHSQQTIHKIDTDHVNTYSPSVQISESAGYDYPKPSVKFEELPKSFVQYTTAQPAVALQTQPSSTYRPQAYSHQIINNIVEQTIVPDSPTPVPQVEIKYAQPAVNLYETPTVSTYRPNAYSHQTIHKVAEQKLIPVSSTLSPQVEIKYQQPAVTVYENPLIYYTRKQTPPVTYVQPTQTIYTEPKAEYVQNYQPLVHQHKVKHVVTASQYQPLEQNYETQNIHLNQEPYSYPEIQRDVETFNSGTSYSQSSATSHQVYHQTATKSQDNKAVFVSTTPSTLVYEDHYTEYESPKKVSTYKAPEYIPPKKDFNIQPYIAVSTQSPSVIHQQQHSVVHDSQNQNYYKPIEYSEQYDISQKSITPIQQVSFSTTHEQPKNIVESIHISSYPSQAVTSTYKPVSYQTPEIQIGYKAEEYLPPIVSVPKPIVTSTPKTQTYLPPIVSTSRDYLPPSSELKYATPEYLPPSTTARPIIKSTTILPTNKYEKPTPAYKAPEYLPPLEELNGPNVVSFESFGLRNIDSSASKIRYNPYEEYLTKNDAAPVVVSTTSLPIERQQNIVVETSKSNLLGFGTVGPNAGLVSPVHYTTAAPSLVTHEYYTPEVVSSSYAPIKQEIVEVTPAPVPIRRTKPKVAVVTKINDFNPLLVRKLGAVCSCQSPVLVLKGKRPNVQIKQDYDVDYYGNDYDDSGRGDIDEGEYAQKVTKTKSSAIDNEQLIKTVTTSPIVSSSINPIIVPDDSYYQDYQEASHDFKYEQSPQIKEVYSETFVSSTPAYVSPTTERIVRIRPRVKAVTPAPTYKTVLVKEVITPAALVDSHHSGIESQTFDRYGPGGWRSRDETLQGSVDCQRAGLFRHPKQCNKFYACRWDCTKQRFTLHVFNCPVQLSFDPTIGACNWPSQGPACQGDTLLTNTL